LAVGAGNISFSGRPGRRGLVFTWGVSGEGEREVVPSFFRVAVSQLVVDVDLFPHVEKRDRVDNLRGVQGLRVMVTLFPRETGAPAVTP